MKSSNIYSTYTEMFCLMCINNVKLFHDLLEISMKYISYREKLKCHDLSIMNELIFNHTLSTKLACDS